MARKTARPTTSISVSPDLVVAGAVALMVELVGEVVALLVTLVASLLELHLYFCMV